MDKKLVYVDTDVSLGTPGAEIDDGAALIFLLRNQSVEVLGAGSIFGNVPVQEATLNLDRMLTWLNADHIPIGIGAERPLLTDMAWFEDWQAGYQETLPWKARPNTARAANLLIDTICANPGQVALLALGPLTNLALAVRLQPATVRSTREVIVMGGSFNLQNPMPEFNARCDPEAAQIVFSAGWNVHLLGLDITRRVHFSRRDFASLPGDNPALDLLRTQAPGWIDRVEAMGWGKDGCALHDAVAAAYLIDPTIFEIEKVSVDVERTDPELRGLTRFSADAKGAAFVTVVTGLDTTKCRDLIWSDLTQ